MWVHGPFSYFNTLKIALLGSIIKLKMFENGPAGAYFMDLLCTGHPVYWSTSERATGTSSLPAI